MIKRHLILLVVLTGIMIIVLFLMLTGPRMHNNSPTVDKNEPDELIFISHVHGYESTDIQALT
jgi:hypothetical protein